MARILLVEDNDLNRDMLSRRLSKRGYAVLLAVDGAEGVRKAEADLPDLILMDVSLPAMDGLEATRLIRGRPKTARIPVIALTAHALATDREDALAAGCDAFHTKPVDIANLVETIENLLSRQLQPSRGSAE